jgi:mRNA interferase RelE/StbE
VYEVFLENAAERDLRRLPVQVFQRVISHIKALAEEPRPPGCRKIVGTKNDWRLRVGNYRIIYEIDQRAQSVRVLRVRYRREAYR